MIKKRIVCSLIVVCVLALGLVGTVTAAEKIKIPWMSHWWTEGGYKEWQESIEAAFETKYPNVDVVAVALPWEVLTEQELISLATPNPPGIILNWIGNVGQFAATGLLEPLDDYIAKTDIPKRFIPNSLEYAKDAQGNIIAIPNQVTTSIFFAREDLLDEAGLGVPTNMQELYEAAKKITNPEKGIFGMGERIHGKGSSLFQHILFWTKGYGGDYAVDGNLTLNSPEVIAALLYSKRFFREGLAPIVEDQSRLRGMFWAGKVGMIHDAPHLKNVFLDKNPELYDKILVALVPTREHNGGLIAVFSSIPKNFKEKEWAFRLLEFMSQDEWGYKFTELTKQPYVTGRMPEKVLAENPWMEVIVEQLNYSEPAVVPGFEAYSVEIETRLTSYLVEALTGSRPIEQVMDEAQRDLVRWAKEKK